MYLVLPHFNGPIVNGLSHTLCWGKSHHATQLARISTLAQHTACCPSLFPALHETNHSHLQLTGQNHRACTECRFTLMDQQSMDWATHCAGADHTMPHNLHACPHLCSALRWGCLSTACCLNLSPALHEINHNNLQQTGQNLQLGNVAQKDQL